MEKSNKLQRLLDGLFYLAFALFLISALLEATTFSDLPFVLRIVSPLRKTAWLIALVKIAVQEIGELISKRYRLRWFPLLFLAAMALCYYFCRVPHILSLCIFSLAANGISFKKIAAHAFLVHAGALLATVGCYFAGIIKGIDVANPNDPTAYSLGYNSPNCLMLVGFMLLVLYGYLRKDRMRWFEFPLLLGWSLLFYIATQGRMGFLAALLVILALAIWRYQWMQRGLEKLRFLIKPFAAILCVGFLLLTYIYVQWDLARLNELTSFRLYFAHHAFANIGLSPFGQAIEWIGQRGADLSAEGYNYNYVDSSYAKGLLEYGIIPMVLMLFAFFKQKALLYQKKEYLLILLLIIIEFYCFFESFLIPPIFNITILLMKDVLYPFQEKE